MITKTTMIYHLGYHMENVICVKHMRDTVCVKECAGYRMRESICGIPYAGCHTITSAIVYRQVYIFQKSPYYPYITGRPPDMEERL